MTALCHACPFQCTMNGPDLLFPTAQALVALMADTARKDGLPRRAAYTARHGVLCTTVADLAGVSAAEADAALAKPMPQATPSDTIIRTVDLTACLPLAHN